MGVGSVKDGTRGQKQLGGSDVGDALGGDLCATAGAHLGFPFPHPVLAKGGLRGQVFANTGVLLPADKNKPRDLWDSARVSVGMGLVAGTPVGRVEANYVVPLQHDDSDASQSVQFGI